MIDPIDTIVGGDIITLGDGTYQFSNSRPYGIIDSKGSMTKFTKIMCAFLVKSNFGILNKYGIPSISCIEWLTVEQENYIDFISIYSEKEPHYPFTACCVDGDVYSDISGSDEYGGTFRRSDFLDVYVLYKTKIACVHCDFAFGRAYVDSVYEISNEDVTKIYTNGNVNRLCHRRISEEERKKELKELFIDKA